MLVKNRGKEIKVRIKDNLRRSEYYNIIENDKKAANPWNILSPGQTSKRRKEEALKRKITGYTKTFAKRAGIITFTLGIILIGWSKIYAYTDDITMYGGKKLVTVYDDQVKEIMSRGWSKTKVIDILTLRTLECNRYDGLCYGIKNRDLGFFQINNIYKKAYKHSLLLIQQRKSAELFLYQLDFVSDMYDRLDRDYCNSYNHYLAGMKFTNRSHFRCMAYSYNGSPRYKQAYANIGWLKRAKVKEYLNNNFYNKG